MAGADSEVGGREHHGHRRLTEVVLEPVSVELVGGFGRDKGDRGRRLGDVAGVLPDLGQPRELVAVGDDDEVPRLPVARRRGPAAGLEDLVEMVRRQRVCGKAADVAPGSDGVPGLHAAPFCGRS